MFKEDGQEYAQATKMLGNGRLEAICFDGVTRLCHIREKLRKKVWINQSDIQDAKADVILKYSADEARNLKSYGENPSRSMTPLSLEEKETMTLNLMTLMALMMTMILREFEISREHFIK